MKVAYAALFVLLLGVVGVTKVMAQDFSVGNLNYTINEDGTTVTLTGHVDGTNATGNLVIPSSVTYYGSAYAVTAIANSAFKDCNSLTGSLVIPNSVNYIGGGAFMGCTGYTGSLNIPNAVTYIGGNAFNGCTGFTGSLNIPNAVTYIGGGAFNGCTGFSGSLTIGEAVSQIHGSAFANTGFTTLNFNAKNCTAFNSSWLSGVTSLHHLNIGENVQRIPDGFLSDFSNITGSLTIPNAVTYIGSNAFMGCSGFSGTLTLGLSLTEIGNSAFFGACAGFTSFVIRAQLPPTTGSNVFSSVPANIPVYVPCGTLDDYQEASTWGSFVNLQETNPCEWTISASPNSMGCGTVSGAGAYIQGQTCTLTATPIGLFEFVNWTEDGQVVSTNPTYSFTVTGNRILVANFEMPGCDIIVNLRCWEDYWDEQPRLVISMAEYDLSTVLYLRGGYYTYTIRIVEGSHVTFQWYGDVPYGTYYNVKFANGYPIFDSNQSGNLSFEFDMNCDDAFNPVTISAVPNVEGRGTVSGAGSFIIGETCTLTATANAGHRFTRWMEDGMEVSTDATYTFTVDGPRNLIAAFSAPVDQVIDFADPLVESSCVYYWDTDGDGALSYDEAAAVTGLRRSFEYGPITSFDELQYFTGLTYLNEREFRNCGNLTSIILPESLNYIGEEAFLNCGSLRGAITLPESLLEVYGNAFASCDELTTINYNANNCTMMGNAQKPVFYDCVSLEHINIGANVQNIPNYAFKRCSTVTDITVAAVTPPTIGPNTFGTVSRSIPVFVPVGSGEAYRTAPYWEEFFNIIEGSGPTSNHYHCNMHQFSHNMSLVGVVQINGVEQSNDFLEVGAFCGDECRGSQLLTTYPALNRSMVFLTLFGESGDLISFRLYDHNTGEESMLGCTTVIPFEADGIVGSYNAPQILNFIPMQNTALETGWSWFSTYIDQTGINGLLMMEECLGENGVMIKSHTDGFVMYDESGWTGTLEAIHPESMYMVNTNAPAMLSVTGSFTDPAQHPVTLYTGWNWVGYPSISVASLNNALSGFNAQDGDVIKSHGLFSQYVNGIGWTGALQMLKPGMGFMYHSLNGGVTQLTYSVSAKDDISVFNGTNEVCHWVANVNAYPYNMSVVAVVELEGMEARDSRYELAAFAGNECRGSARLMYVEALDRYLAFLTVVGIGQAELRWALYDTETGEVGYNTETLRFEQDAILGAVKDPLKVSFAKFNATDDTFVNDLIVYPNPVRCDQMVRISLPAHGEVTVEIVDALGAVLSSERVKGEIFEIKAPDTAGVYAVKVTVDGKGVSCSKMIVR